MEKDLHIVFRGEGPISPGLAISISKKTYWVKKCTPRALDFAISAKEGERIWTITENDTSLIVSFDVTRIAFELTFSDALDTNCAESWNRNFSGLTFGRLDTASNYFRGHPNCKCNKTLLLLLSAHLLNRARVTYGKAMLGFSCHKY